jgi:hypothetical protein
LQLRDPNGILVENIIEQFCSHGDSIYCIFNCLKTIHPAIASVFSTSFALISLIS